MSGLTATDAEAYSQALAPFGKALSKRDERLLEKMSRPEFLNQEGQGEVVKIIQFLKKFPIKYELESLHEMSPGFLVKVLLETRVLDMIRFKVM